MKHVYLRFSFESAPPFTGPRAQCAPASIICIPFPTFACPVWKRCVRCCTFSVGFRLTSVAFSAMIYAGNRLSFCFACLSFTGVRPAVPDCVCLREKACLVSLRAVRGSNPLLLFRLPRQPERIRRKRHHCFFSCLRPCGSHSGCPALPDVGYRFFVPNGPEARLSACSEHC